MGRVVGAGWPGAEAPLILLLSLVAAAAVVDRVPTGAERVSLVVCVEDDTCREEGRAVLAAGADGGLPLVTFDVLLEQDQGGVVGGIDQQQRYDEALALVHDAVAARRWAAAGSAADEALAALKAWPGTVAQEELFLLWFAQGAARLKAGGKDLSWQFSFRQAAAMVDGHPGGLPASEPEVQRAFQEELRKLTVAGRGRLLVGPVFDDGSWFVDGRALPVRAAEVSLLPGQHRVTASRRGAIRTWKAEVPVLAERSSAVTADFSEGDDAGWIRQHIVDAFDTLTAPDAVTGWLADWCARQGLVEVRLVMLEVKTEHRVPPPVGFTTAPDTRPAAAEGEVIDLGDGVPSSFEDHVEALYDQGRAPHPVQLPGRVRVAWFDARSRRFRADGGTSVALEPEPAGRVAVGLTAGYARIFDHHHAAADLAVRATAWRAITVEGRLGLVRSDAVYNLYQDWTDRQLYHCLVAARIDHPWGPFALVGPELYVPVSLGAVVGGGVGAPFGRSWALQAEALAHLGGDFGWSAGLGVVRRY